MLALALPPLLARFREWITENPALGTVAVLAIAVVLLWVVRKSIKFFMVICLLLVAAILASYFFQGEEKTNRLIREGGRQVLEEGRELVDKVKELSEGSEDEGEAEGSGDDDESGK